MCTLLTEKCSPPLENQAWETMAKRNLCLLLPVIESGLPLNMSRTQPPSDWVPIPMALEETAGGTRCQQHTLCGGNCVSQPPVATNTIHESGSCTGSPQQRQGGTGFPEWQADHFPQVNWGLYCLPRWLHSVCKQLNSSAFLTLS